MVKTCVHPRFCKLIRARLRSLAALAPSRCPDIDRRQYLAGSASSASPTGMPHSKPYCMSVWAALFTRCTHRAEAARCHASHHHSRGMEVQLRYEPVSRSRPSNRAFNIWNLGNNTQSAHRATPQYATTGLVLLLRSPAARPPAPTFRRALRVDAGGSWPKSSLNWPPQLCSAAAAGPPAAACSMCCRPCSLAWWTLLTPRGLCRGKRGAAV